MSFCVRLLSLSIMLLRLIRVVSISHSFYWQEAFHCMNRPHPSPADEHLGVSTFRLLWKMLLWTFTDKSLCGDMLSFLLGTHLEGELLDHRLILFNIWEIANACWLQHFFIPISNAWWFSSLYILDNICHFFYMIVTLLGVSGISLWFSFSFP